MFMNIHRYFRTDTALIEAIKGVTWHKIGEVDRYSFQYPKLLIYRLTNPTPDFHTYTLSKEEELFRDILRNEPSSEEHHLSILDFQGLSASKTHDPFPDLHTFAYQHLIVFDESFPNDRGHIRFQTDRDFQNNIQHIGTHRQFDVYHHQWENTFFISNSDGSHHIAAVYRQCRDQNRDFKIRCRIIKTFIDAEIVHRITTSYFCFIVHSSTTQSLSLALFPFEIPRYAMTIERALVSIGKSTRPELWEENRSIFLIGRDHPQSRVVYEALSKLDKSYCFDVNTYLNRLVEQQEHLKRG